MISDDGLIGIVDVVIAARDGTDAILIVGDGWFGERRLDVPVTDASDLDEANRIVRLKTAAHEDASAR